MTQELLICSFSNLGLLILSGIIPSNLHCPFMSLSNRQKKEKRKRINTYFLKHPLLYLYIYLLIRNFNISQFLHRFHYHVFFSIFCSSFSLHIEFVKPLSFPLTSLPSSFIFFPFHSFFFRFLTSYLFNYFTLCSPI